MIITNSLGANYSGEDIRLSLALLFQPWKWKRGKEIERLEQKIEGLMEGSDLSVRSDPSCVQLFYKGRQAIGEALRILKIGSGDEVIVQAFTCVAVVRPILEAGAMPVYVDVAPKSLNPPLSSIKQRVTARTKAVILQHTLGVANPENEEIVSWCKQKGFAIIQDLAHSLGASGLKRSNLDASRLDLNTFYILSFSQDKVADGISGGGLVVLNQTIAPAPRLNDLNHLTLIEIGKMLLYPICTWLIRSTYKFGIGGFSIGKGIHWLAKLIGLMNSPVGAPAKPAAMPNALAALTLGQMNRLEEISQHRQKISMVYDNFLSTKLKLVSRRDIQLGSNLRYPIWVNNRDELESKLKQQCFYLLDHWYDAPVSPDWVDPNEVGYRPGSCTNAEELSRHIFNLPTHVNISLNQATHLANLVNTYTTVSK